MEPMRFLKPLVVAILVGGAFALIFTVIRSAAPSRFPTGAIVTIPANASLSAAAAVLQRERVIASSFFYKVYVVLLGGERNIIAGDYLFAEPQSALKIAERTIKGAQGVPRNKITIPEGSSSKDIAKIIKRDIPTFDTSMFLSLAKPHEGYLFPETYFFYETVTPEEVIKEMRSTFDSKIAEIKKEVASSSISLAELITMASIVEREGMTEKDRKIIAGILWKRLNAGMALQVDATFYYLLGKPSSQLTVDDLKMNSPYNTYTNTGLPPGPIANPGLQAIQDTLHPTKTPYWYYLSSKDGKMYYASDLTGHVENKRKYL
jgi:UPF0755 protein